MVKSHRNHRVAALIGVAIALIDDSIVRTLWPHRVIAFHSVALVVAGITYPAFRRSDFGAKTARKELVQAGSYGTIGVIAAIRNTPRAGQVAALTWITHAVFDISHTTGPQSNLPQWYPAYCAGFDIALALRMLHGIRRAAPSISRLPTRSQAGVV